MGYMDGDLVDPVKRIDLGLYRWWTDSDLVGAGNGSGPAGVDDVHHRCHHARSAPPQRAASPPRRRGPDP